MTSPAIPFQHNIVISVFAMRWNVVIGGQLASKSEEVCWTLPPSFRDKWYYYGGHNIIVAICYFQHHVYLIPHGKRQKDKLSIEKSTDCKVYIVNKAEVKEMEAETRSSQKDSEVTRLVGGVIAVISVGAGSLMVLVLPIASTSAGSLGYILSASLFFVGLSLFLVGQVQLWKKKK
jgi:hypothetical protein